MASKLSLPFGKKNAAPAMPTKTTMNLAIREINEADRKSNIVIAVIGILAVVLLGKFGFWDVFSELQDATNKRNDACQEYLDTSDILVAYKNAAEYYSHYFNAFLTDEELALLDRIELLDTLQDVLFDQGAQMQTIQVTDNTVITQFSGVTLQKAGELQMDMLKNKHVLDAFFTVAQTDKEDAGIGEDKEVVVTMTVIVQQTETESGVTAS